MIKLENKVRTCKEIETELGLERDAIRSITYKSDGSVDVDAVEPLSDAQLNNLEAFLGLKTA